jgi:hypothetical protein
MTRRWANIVKEYGSIKERGRPKLLVDDDFTALDNIIDSATIDLPQIDFDKVGDDLAIQRS